MYNYILICSREMERVFIVTYWIQNMASFPLPANVEFILLPAKPAARKSLHGMGDYLYHKLTGCPTEYLPLRKKLFKYKDSLVHCHFGNRGIEFMKIRREMRVRKKFIVSFYGYDIDYLAHTEPGYVEQLQELWTSCSGVFCEGPFMLNRMKVLGLPSNKGYLNPIVIDTESYQKKIAQPSKEAKKISDYLIIGRFVEKKGIHLSLSALGKLKQNGYNDFRITIVGDGPMKDAYQGIIDEYNLNEQVNFTGMLSLKRCKELLVEHDVLLHPSLESATKDSEGGAPTIIIEAQCLGTLVISSFHADIPFVMGYHDLLCKENDENDLMRVIQKCIEMPSGDRDTLIEKGRSIVLKQHSFSSNRYLENLRCVLHV